MRKALNVWISLEADTRLRELATQQGIALNRAVELAILAYSPNRAIPSGDNLERLSQIELRLAVIDDLQTTIAELTQRITVLETKPTTPIKNCLNILDNLHHIPHPKPASASRADKSWDWLIDDEPAVEEPTDDSPTSEPLLGSPRN